MKLLPAKLVGSILALLSLSIPFANSAEVPLHDKLREAEALTLAVAAGELDVESMYSAQLQLFREFNTPGEVNISRFSQPTILKSRSFGEYCRTDGVNFEQKAILGNVLYTFWQTVEICASPGFKVHSVNIIDRGGETKTPTWSYDGEASPPASYAIGNGWFVRTSENFEQNFANAWHRFRTTH